MVLGIQEGIGNVAALVAAAAMLGLAAMLLAVRFSNRLHQSLALLLVLQAVFTASFAFTSWWYDYAGRLIPYFLIAIPFAAVVFALNYSTTHGRSSTMSAVRPWLSALLLVAAIGFEIAYLLDHSLMRTATTYGPYQVFFALPSVVFAIITVQMLRDYRASPPGRRRQSFIVAALGFSLAPVKSTVFHFLGPTGDLLLASRYHTGHFASPYLFSADMLRIVPMAILGVASWVLVRKGRDREYTGRRREVVGFLLIWAAAAAVGAYDSMQLRIPDGEAVLQATQVHRAIDAVVLVSGTLLITFAIVRHQLFDIDLKVKFTLRASTLAAAFLAVFFVVGQLAQNFLNDAYGLLVGGVAAGLLLFALNPLQKVAERMADKAMPGAKPVASLSHRERHSIYREQLEIAWSDGTLNRKERLQFERLRQRLDLSAEEALALENGVLGGAPAGKVGKRGAKSAA